jgi:hypothetical protein
MRIVSRVDDGGLIAALQSAPQRTKERAAKTVKSVSFAVEKRIKNEMPVDSGRARASWGHWTPSDIVKPNSEASKTDTIWKEKNDGLTIIQGTNVPYVLELNQGSSTKAPRAFIDKAADSGAEELKAQLNKMLGRTLQ